MPNAIEQNAEIERDLATIAQNPIQQLRQRWRVAFCTEPPPAFGPDLLRRSIAQRIQAQHYGGLSATAQKELEQIVKAMASKPSGRIQLPRQIKPGAILVRTWKDKSHRVTVLGDGFSYEARTYVSLSQIAREITGTRWNGPKFFGLRVKNLSGETPRRRSRPPAAGTNLLNSDMEVGHGL